MTTKHSEQLKLTATRAGIIDLDALALADLARDDGSVKGAAELVAALKEAKPFLFQQKKAKDMTVAERAEALAAIKGGPKPEPMPIDKTAREMSSREREAWLHEHSRRFG